MSDFLDSAEEGGRAAALSGKNRKACPFHSGGVMKAAWIRGFTKGEAELRMAKEAAR